MSVGYYTGMRVGEIFGMTWDRVDMKEGYVNLRADDTKTGEARDVSFLVEERRRCVQPGNKYHGSLASGMCPRSLDLKS